MVGLTSYGAYVPFYRLSRAELARAWGRRLPEGEKAVANQDEDSVTMAVAAALDCVDGLASEQIDGLFFASTTTPYKEKLSAATVATAVDLQRNSWVADFTNSLRAGTSALMAAINAVSAGAASQVLVTAADCRLGAPRSEFESNFGDGAAALLIGDKDVAVVIEDYYQLYDEFIDIWRKDTDTFVRAWEDRFVISQGYMRNVREVISKLMQKCNLAPDDFTKAILYAPDARRQTEMARSLGFDAVKQGEQHLLAEVGNTGTALALMMLVAALEEAKAGDRILLANYGDGADAFILRVTDEIENLRNKRGIKGHLQPKAMLPSYEKYLSFRGILPVDAPRRPPAGGVAAPEEMVDGLPRLWRDQNGILRFYGTKCKVCGAVQFPPNRVCVKCQAKDEFEEVRLRDKGAEVYAYSIDSLASPIEPAIPRAIINFRGGGRMWTYITDCDASEVKVGMPVEMTFRRIPVVADYYNYFWKAKPAR